MDGMYCSRMTIQSLVVVIVAKTAANGHDTTLVEVGSNVKLAGMSEFSRRPDCSEPESPSSLVTSLAFGSDNEPSRRLMIAQTASCQKLLAWSSIFSLCLVHAVARWTHSSCDEAIS